MASKWLSYANLSDEYERKARFLPAVLSILPMLPLLGSLGVPASEYVKVLIGGIGLGAIVAVGLSHVASACGNRLQASLWPSWPHDAPTHRQLHPDDTSVSSQQKERWYQAIKKVVQLDIEAAVEAGDPNELKAVINDAVQALRNRLWKAPEAERARLHNVEYGFARNLTGLWPVWGSLAAASLIGCWVAYIWYDGPLLWALIAVGIVLGVGALALSLPAYVRKRAHDYAESFLEGVVAVSGEEPGTATDRSPPLAGP